MKKISIVILFICFVSFNLMAAAAQFTTQPHENAVNDIVLFGDYIYTAGDDGFIIRWQKIQDEESGTFYYTGEHYQFSDMEIKKIALSPDGENIAIYETDGYAVNRVSIWNWASKTRVLARRVTNTVSSIAYSAKGTYLLIGVNSTEGIIFLNLSNGKTVRKLQDTPSMVSFTMTSETENTCVMYSSLGDLIYSNMVTTDIKAELSVTSNLQQTLLFNNDLMFAGYKDGYIYIFQSVTGTQLAKIKASSPLFASGREDYYLYYIEQNGKNCSLKMIQTSGNTVFINPVIVKDFTTSGESPVTSVVKKGTQLFVGCKNGSVQNLSSQAQIEKTVCSSISQMQYKSVLDIESYDGQFYVLTDSSLFITDYTDESSILLANPGYNNILVLNEKTLLFWSKDSTKAIQKATKRDNGTWRTENLYSPGSTLQSLHYQNDRLVIVEGSSTVRLFDFSSNKAKTVYSGTGIQDALLLNQNDLYVAKSAASTPKAALVKVNTQTLETLPIDISAEVAFSLSPNTSNSNLFYGVCVFSGDSQKTDVFSYNVSTKKYSTLMSWGDEDTQAFTWYSNGKIYTNIAKSQIRSVNTSSKQQITYTRFSSIPKKIAGNKTYILVLNRDGSISWYSASTNRHYANWQVSMDNKLVEE